MHLQINWFRIAFSTNTLTLPMRTFESADAATAAMRADALHGITLYRSRPDSTGEIKLVALCGVDGKRPDWEDHEISATDEPYVFSHVAEISLAAHLKNREGLRAWRDRWGLEALQEDEDFEHPALRLFRGVTGHAQSDDDGNLGLIANWQVRGEFRLSLANAQMASRAIDAPVELRVETDTWPLSPALKRYNRKYLGRVRSIKGRNAEILTRHGEDTKVPVAYLYFESSPARIRDYETSFMRQTRAASAWTRMQQLSHALTKQGKRNPLIFRDRIRAIIEFLGQDVDFLICEAVTYVPAQISFDLQPRSLTAEALE